MKKRKSRSQVRVEHLSCSLVRTRLNFYWQPVAYGWKKKPILTSVDCLFNLDYYSEKDAAGFLRVM